MKKYLLFTFLFFSFYYNILGQNYTTYFTGNTTNISTNPTGGICLMGSATEDDNAMQWFLQQASILFIITNR